MNAFIPAAMKLSSVRPRQDAARARIAYGQIFSRLLEEAEVLRFCVISGHLWVTQEGSRRDHLLVAGDVMSFAGPGRLVAEGIEDGALVELAE